MCAFRNDIHKGSAADALLNKGKTHKQTDQKKKSSESGLIAHITTLGAITRRETVCTRSNPRPLLVLIVSENGYMFRFSLLLFIQHDISRKTW